MDTDFRRSIRRVTHGMACLGFFVAASAGAAPPADIHHESVDDPPGIPTEAEPGATAARVSQRGGFTTVQVNTNVNGSNIPGDAANEPSIVVDPTDPLRMAIGWRQFDTIASNFRQAGNAYSTDGGRTWTNSPVLTPGTFRSDPVLASDATGRFYYNSLKGDLTADVFTSTDAGATWAGPVVAFGGDKLWMTVDRTEGLGSGHIYQSWSPIGTEEIFNRSLDEGESFTTPSTIPDLPRWGTLGVTSDGTVCVVGIGMDSEFYIATSSDAQDPEVATPTFTTSAVDLGGEVVAGSGPNPGGLLGQIWFAIDESSGPTAGDFYIAATLDPEGPDPMDVLFVRSTDEGSTWSSPVRVNDDPGNDWQWMGTMSASPSGRIDLVWVDHRESGEENIGALYYSSSTDGGATWAANVAASLPWDTWLGWPNQSKIGDYYHMISDRVGADLAWAATLNGEQDVYFTRIGDYDCNQNGIGDEIDISSGDSPDANGNGIPDECEGVVDVPEMNSTATGIQNFPNPFKESTAILFDVRESGRVKLEIFNVSGQLVRTLIDLDMTAGAQQVRWDATDSAGRKVAPGIYLYRLEAPGTDAVRRVMVLK